MRQLKSAEFESAFGFHDPDVTGKIKAFLLRLRKSVKQIKWTVSGTGQLRGYPHKSACASGYCCPLTAILSLDRPHGAYTPGDYRVAGRHLGLSDSQATSIAMAADWMENLEPVRNWLRMQMMEAIGLSKVKDRRHGSSKAVKAGKKGKQGQ